MGPLGMPELIVIFVIALLVFGPRKLPELGRSLGKSLGEFKRASNELRNTLEEEIKVEERKEERAKMEAEQQAAAAASGATSSSTPTTVAVDDGTPLATAITPAPADEETVSRGTGTSA